MTSSPAEDDTEATAHMDEFVESLDEARKEVGGMLEAIECLGSALGALRSGIDVGADVSTCVGSVESER